MQQKIVIVPGWEFVYKRKQIIQKNLGSQMTENGPKWRQMEEEKISEFF